MSFGEKGASGVAQTIVGQFPPHTVFIDLFAGGGTIAAAKTAASEHHLIELETAKAIDLKQRFHNNGQHGPWTQIYNCNAFDFLAKNMPGILKRCEHVLIYADPPYLPSTRTSRTLFEHELTEADHARLLAKLKELSKRGAHIAISGYASKLYAHALKDWRRIEFQAWTRGGPRTEVLWMNYPAGLVHWHTHAGKDHNDRIRIKRKAATWKRRFALLPQGEQTAVLAAIMETMEEGNRQLAVGNLLNEKDL